jgi:hypothetical protein
MRDESAHTPQRYREKAKALRELALKTKEPQERRELLGAAKQMEIMASELARAINLISGAVQLMRAAASEPHRSE